MTGRSNSPQRVAQLGKQFIKQIFQKVPVGADLPEYVARRTGKITPAQIQEVIYSLVIPKRQDMTNDDCGCFQFSTETIDKAIAKINGNKQQRLEFILSYNHNGDHHDIIEIQR